MRGTCYHHFYFENLMCALIYYFSLSLFFLSQFSLHFFARVPKPFTENLVGAQIYLLDNSPISPTVSFHISLSLSLYIYIYIVAYVFVFLLNFIYIYFFGFGVEDLCAFDKSHMNYEFSLFGFVDLMN